MFVYFFSLNEKIQRYRAMIWSGLVFVTSIGIEHLGVITGSIFGEYYYPSTLGLKIGQEPLVIGFA